jgi:cysteate synthase
MLACPSCGWRREDDGLILRCPQDHAPALLQTEYASRQFKPYTDRDGIFRYQDWLPVVGEHHYQGRTAVYRSKRLAKALGISNLWIAFNGYWPERGAELETATFKEFEAYTVLGRLPEQRIILTVASSGNTGAAFAWACSKSRQPCLLIVPERGLNRLRFQTPLDPCVRLVVIDNGDYPDAIDLAATISHTPPFYPEGGIQNVGRRDGLATVLLSAFEEMQCLPTHYFQAVGSGTGAIAVLEAARRVQAAAGDLVLPRLLLCQNLPFAPIYDAWRMNLCSLSRESPERFRKAIMHVYADELTNWKPPYEIAGGVYDSLVQSHGDVVVADNDSVRTAMDMFLELEGSDIEPAAGVAVACLAEYAAQEKFDKKSIVLLNVTGGGRRRLSQDYRLLQVEPNLRLRRDSLADPDTVQNVIALK